MSIKTHLYLFGAIALGVEFLMVDTNKNQNGSYFMEGPVGLNASFNPTSGVLIINRILNQPINIQTTESSATSFATTANSSGETTTKIFHRKQQAQTAAVAIQLLSLQQSDTTNNTEVVQQLVSLDGCHFDNISVGQSDCYAFICVMNHSTLQQDICFVKLDDPFKSVVKVTYLIADWDWCRLPDQSLCRMSQLDLVFKLWIDKDLSISKAGETFNSSSYNLGFKNAYVQFDKSYIERMPTLSTPGLTVPSFTLSNAYAAKFTVTLNHTMNSPVTNLTYELIIDPGYEADLVTVISGSQIKMAGFISSLIIFSFLMPFDLF